MSPEPLSLVFEDDALMKELQGLAEHHKDASRAAMYLAVVEELQAGRQKLILLIKKSRESRLELGAGHWANLWAHVIEYPFLIDRLQLSLDQRALVPANEDGTHYANFDVAAWKLVLEILLDDDLWVSKFSSLLKEKHTQTFVLQRYVAAHTILKRYFDGNDSGLSIVDCGSSLGIGPTAMTQDQSFVPLDDNTPGQIINHSIQKGLSIDKSYCLDITDPTDKEIEHWIMACSFYPGESVYYDDFERKLSRLKSIRESDIFVGEEGDITILANLWKIKEFHQVDAVIANTVLYQLTGQQRMKFYQQAEAVLNEGGMLIITDFARKQELDSKILDFNEGGWFGGKRYRTFVLIKEEGKLTPPLEIFQFPDARCKEVYPGEDYSSFFS